jgi:signal transduction histidine kinase
MIENARDRAAWRDWPAHRRATVIILRWPARPAGPDTMSAMDRPPVIWARPLAWLRRHPLLCDTVLAAVLAAAGLPPVSTIVGPNQALAAALIIALAAPLIWRRRAPAAVFAVIFVLAMVQLLVNAGEGNDLLPLACAFYTVATREPRWLVLVAAGALEIGAALAPHAWAIYTVLIAFTMLLGYYARTRRAYIAALVDRADRLERERDQQTRLAAAAERARIAREVHDIVAHNIAVMTALADGAAYTAEASPGQAAELMGQVSQTGRSALAEMRRLIAVLRDPPASSPQPALDDIDDLLGTVRAAGLPVTMTTTGQPFPLAATALLTIYRIIQEALTNTLKHAPGATARISVGYQPGQVDLEITDTGRPGDGVPGTGGAPPAGAAPGTAAAATGGGHGIAGMRERAALFDGQVTAGPAPGGGWRIHATLRPERADGAPAAAAGSAETAAGTRETSAPATIGEAGTADGAGLLASAEGT